VRGCLVRALPAFTARPYAGFTGGGAGAAVLWAGRLRRRIAAREPWRLEVGTTARGALVPRACAARHWSSKPGRASTRRLRQCSALDVARHRHRPRDGAERSRPVSIERAAAGRLS
jgi:hypothetical protein